MILRDPTRVGSTFRRAMKPTVMSMFSVCSYVCDEPHVVISVRSPHGDKVQLPDNPSRLGVLFLEFHDVTDNTENYADNFMEQYGFAVVPFSDGHACEIANFLSKHADAKAIVCNCEAGISRSSAIAAAIAKATEDDDEQYFKRYHPNTLVYRTLLGKLQRG